jgi:hypothetical protein
LAAVFYWRFGPGDPQDKLPDEADLDRGRYLASIFPDIPRPVALLLFWPRLDFWEVSAYPAEIWNKLGPSNTA